MSLKEIIRLADKFEETKVYDDQALYKNQGILLDHFYQNFLRKLKAITSEIEGDLLALKHKGIDRVTFYEISQLWEHLIEISKDISSTNPYKAAERLITEIDPFELLNINKKIQKILEKTSIPGFKETEHMKQTSIDSIKLLIVFMAEIRTYMDENPIVENPKNKPLPPPPELVNEHLDQFRSYNDEEATNPGKK